MNVFILYKTVRLETGEYYIGIHGINTDRYPRFNDPYLGSGIRILAAKKKYGRKAFVRSILSISESRDVVLALEAVMVTAEMIADPLCLNLVPGGRGGVRGILRPDVTAALKGVPKSAEHCQAISDALKGNPSPLKGIPKGPQSNEHRQAISDAKKGVPCTEKRRQAIGDCQRGVPKSAEHRQAISAATKGVPKSVEHRHAISDAMKASLERRKVTISESNSKSR